jgi:hypothetical protein
MQIEGQRMQRKSANLTKRHLLPRANGGEGFALLADTVFLITAQQQGTQTRISMSAVCQHGGAAILQTTHTMHTISSSSVN